MATRTLEQQIKDWIERCRQDESLGPLDDRYCRLEIQDHDRTVSLRGPDPIAELQDRIRLSSGDSCQLFSGYSGTGKSTELRRLAHELRQHGYRVLFADMADYHDLYHDVTLEELIIIVAAAFGDEARKQFGGDLPVKGYWERLREFWNSEASLEKLSVGLPFASAAEFKLAVSAPFWLEVRRALEASVSKLRAHAHEFVSECTAALGRASGNRYEPTSGVVFILDSFERISGPENRYQDVVHSVVSVFSQHADVLRLPGCQVVYTVPPYLGLLAQDVMRKYDNLVRPLASVKIHEQAPELRPYRPGIDAMIELIDKRIPVHEVFADRAYAQKLVLASGGHIRTLVMLCHALLVRGYRAGLPANEVLVDRVVADLAEQVKLSVRPEAVTLLDGILRTGTLRDVKTTELELLARHMSAQVVLCYRNGEGWYEVHPLVRNYVRDWAKELRASEQGRS